MVDCRTLLLTVHHANLLKTMAYSEDDMLMLSGIQHYAFCPRQWALIHIEQQWNDNRLTMEGQIQHKNVDNPSYRQKNGGRITLRSVPIASKELGLYGISDAIELIPTDDANNAIRHKRYEGMWLPIPVEYKHGKRKSDCRDIVQVVAQAMCLEEIHGIRIPYGVLYYKEENLRDIVDVTPEIRDLVRHYASLMHEAFCCGITPSANYKPHCKKCSLLDICMPQIEGNRQVGEYLKLYLYEETS